MPFKRYAPDTYASRDDPAATRIGKLEDVVFHFHANDEMDCSSKKRKRPAKAPVTSDSGSMTLPVRTLQTPLGDVKQEPTLPALSYKAASKRRASSVIGSSQPTAVAVVSTGAEFELPLRRRPSFVADAEDSEEEYQKIERGSERSTSPAQTSSDGEFEVVAGPSAVLDASDSDSDSTGSTLVEINHEEVEQLTSGTLNAASTTGAGESDAESDWTLV